MQQLASDLEQHLAGDKKLAVDHGINISGNCVVQRFMTELCFNIGAAVNKDNKFTYNNAADEHLDSRWAKQVKSRANEMVGTLRALDA